MHTIVRTNASTLRQYISHFNATSINSWQFKWIAPSQVTGPVIFYFAGNAANGNMNPSGDNVYTLVHTMLPDSAMMDTTTTDTTTIDTTTFAAFMGYRGPVCYPNPVYRGNSLVINQNLSPRSIQLTGISGNHVPIDARTSNRIDLPANLSQGIYLLEIHTSKTKILEKILIME